MVLRPEYGRPETVAHGPADSYPYIRGLDHLRDLSQENEALARSVAESWLRTAEGASHLRVCDFGSGLGDLILSTLSKPLFGQARKIDIELVDSDLMLAEHAGALVKRELGACARSTTPDRFLADDRAYDLILAAHVLYYVKSRSSLIASLLNRLAPGGSACFVVRSEECDTYKIRSAVRPTQARDAGMPIRRVTPDSVVQTIERHGYSAHLRKEELEVLMPIDDSSIDEALSSGAVSLTAEVIRLLAHVVPGDEASSEFRRSLENELAARSHGGILCLALTDTIISVRAV